jgi:hypothetical protein
VAQTGVSGPVVVDGESFLRRALRVCRPRLRHLAAVEGRS